MATKATPQATLNPDTITGPQLQKLHALRDELGLDDDDWVALLDGKCRVRSSAELTKAQASGIIDLLEERRQQVAAQPSALATAPRSAPVAFPRPIVTAEEFRANFKQFEEFRNAILDPPEKDRPNSGDIVVRKDGSAFIRASGYRKIAVSFGLSHRIVARERIPLDSTEHTLYRIEVEMVAPGRDGAVGRSVSASALCSTLEIMEKSRGSVTRAQAEHWASAMAETRALNRATALMVGGSTVSAEDLEVPEPPEK